MAFEFHLAAAISIRMYHIRNPADATSPATATYIRRRIHLRMTSRILLHRPFHPMSYIRNSGAGWERRRFNFLDQPCPYPPWRLPGSLQAEGRMLHSCSVLLKLPNICDQHFEDLLGYFALDI
uniref:Uncharacterized protein n=1 Tax=Vitis vinifera TaxID=29760 RepID=A5BJB0_VITVI|nr:hypothetical protein VITISV_005015 [Vitis vinifera]